MKRDQHPKPNSKTNPPLFQSLESRQLMSITAGFDGGHARPAPVMDPMAHQISFDQVPPDPVQPALGRPDMGRPDIATFGENPFAGGPFPFTIAQAGSPDFDFLQQQLAHAIAQGNTISISPAAPSVTGATLSSMYSSLPGSTVIQIDTATERSAASIVSIATAAAPTTLSVSASVFAQPATTAAAVNFEPARTFMSDTTGAIGLVTSDRALASAMLPVVAPVTDISATQSLPPSWGMLRKLEDELLAVRAMADEVVSELGRDSAIALSHLELVFEQEMPTAEALRSWSGWRSVAIAGATVAALAYLGSEVDRESAKEKSVFSNKLIELFSPTLG